MGISAEDVIFYGGGRKGGIEWRRATLKELNGRAHWSRSTNEFQLCAACHLCIGVNICLDQGIYIPLCEDCQLCIEDFWSL